MIGVELALAVIATVINRAIALLDSLLGDLFSNKTSEALIRHAAMLDLYQFEDADFYDKLEIDQKKKMKLLPTLLLLFVSFQFAFSQDALLVLSTNGLNIRELPTGNSNVLITAGFMDTLYLEDHDTINFTKLQRYISKPADLFI